MAANACVHYFGDDRALARRIASLAALQSTHIPQHIFPDGERLVRVEQRSGAHAILLRRLDHPDDKIIETILAADALHRAQARTVTLVAPYMPYMRQDRAFHCGEPISQLAIGEILGRSFDAVLTVEPHLHRVRTLREVIPGDSKSVSAAPAIAEWIRANGKDPVVVGPDSESRPLVRAIAKQTNLPFAIGTKRREGDRLVAVEFERLPVRSHAVIVDDIASSGATLAAAARALRSRGISRIEAVVVHAIFAPGAMARIRRANISRVVSCDTVRHKTNAIAIAPLIVAALRRRPL